MTRRVAIERAPAAARAAAVGALATGLVLSALASAQPEPPSPAPEAPAAAQPERPSSASEAPASADDSNAVFQQGLAKYEAGQVAEAAEQWEQLRERLGPDRGWKLLYNLGLAYDRMGDATLAVERFESFLVQVAARVGALPVEYEQRREDAALRLLALKQSHGAVVLPPAVGSVRVRIDDATTRAVGFTAYLQPGDHGVTLIGSAGATRTERITAVAGQSIELDTRDPALALAVAPPTGRRSSGPIGGDRLAEPAEFPTTVVLIGAGLTAAAVVLPTALWYYAADQREEADDLGRGHTGYAAAVEDFESARTAYQVSYLLPATLGAATLGVAIWGLIEVGSTSEAPLPVDGSAVVTSEGGFFWLQARF